MRKCVRAIAERLQEKKKINKKGGRLRKEGGKAENRIENQRRAPPR